MGEEQASFFITRYLQITSVITAAIGCILLLWPEMILEWFIPGATGNFFIRFIGSALFGYATLNGLAARQQSYEVRRIVLDGNLVTLTLATILSIAGVLSGTIRDYQWLLISEHVVFTIGFIYARSVNKKTPRS